MKPISVLALMAVMIAPLNAESHAPLFFREDFVESPPATPATQDHVVNKDLRLGLYGPGKDGVRKSHHDKPADDPYYLWTGTCQGNCAVTLRHDRAFVDLTGNAKIRWRTRQEGFRRLHLVVKLADGKWYVSEQADGESDTWRVTELQLPSMSWRTLDIGKVIEGARAKPDLSRVDEIGFTDLMTGGASRACSRVDWIEVYGASVSR